jgi:MYXO-CTERM domain-containing protein
VNTLADLLSRGAVVVDDVRYYDFVYIRTAGNMPGATGVRVDAPADGARGLVLSSDWSGPGAATRTILLQFKVDVGPSINRFAAVTTTLTGRSESSARVASLTDTVAGLPSDTSFPTINRLVADASGGVFTATQPLSLGATAFAISKALSFQSSSTIASVSTTFTPAHLPEPGLLGLGLLATGLGLRRRRM